MKKRMSIACTIVMFSFVILGLANAHPGVAADTHFAYLPIILNSNSTPVPVPTQTPTPTLTPTPSKTPDLDFVDQVVVLTNDERLAHGCPPVTQDERLRLAAQVHSEDMALNDFFDHTGSDGSSPWDRIHAQGYFFSAAAENIAAGYATPEKVVNGWMNSSGHRANILNCSYKHIGVGYYHLENDTGKENWYHYWTQDFASP